MPKNHLTKKRSLQSSQQQQQQTQIQISQFIKDPATLKLLILAGTNIKPSQFPTVSKCFNLIKLDLSSNHLSQLPLVFNLFYQLKILYLHDNNIYNVNIQNTIIQYISLFNNHIKNYRQQIIQTNYKLMGLDYNIITKGQRSRKNKILSYSSIIKWPIVQTNMILQSQQDYLNLLKAEIFVITNLFKNANHIQYIQNTFKSLLDYKKYQKIIHNQSDQMKMKKYYVLEAVNTWKKYVKKNKKLHKFLQSKGKQSLLFNKLSLNKSHLAPNTLKCVQNFMSSLRKRMSARLILSNYLLSYRSYVKISQKIKNIYYQQSTYMAPKLYFIKSQVYLLQKIFLFAKRLLFNKKDYDLCDNFDKIVYKQKKQYYIFNKKLINHQQKSRNHQEKSFLLNSIRQTKNLIISQKNIDRKHFLYTRKGHKQIGLKNRNKYKYNQTQLKILKSKINQKYNKIQTKYQQYQSLISYSITNKILYDLLLRITQYFNSGNSSTILTNQTAYFQTQVIFKDEQQKNNQNLKIFVGLQFFVKRNIAANIIQKFWRRISAKQKSTINIIKTIKQKRASQMISHWLRNLVFNHRILLNKNLSFLRTLQRTNQTYIQLDIYMNMPVPMNNLKIQKYQALLNDSSQIFYKALHTNTYVQILQLNNRKWVKITFPSSKQVYYVQKLLIILTYKFYYNGFNIKLFNYFQTQQQNLLIQYQTKVTHLYGNQIKITRNNDKDKDKSNNQYEKSQILSYKNKQILTK